MISNNPRADSQGSIFHLMDYCVYRLVSAQVFHGYPSILPLDLSSPSLVVGLRHNHGESVAPPLVGGINNHPHRGRVEDRPPSVLS